jgi:hypothetical protein
MLGVRCILIVFLNQLNKIDTIANMQYTKLRFSMLFKGCSSQQVLYRLIVNRSVTPNLHIAVVECNAKR